MHRLRFSERPVSIYRRNNAVLSPFGPLRELATYLLPSSLHFSPVDDNLNWGRSDGGSLGIHATEMRMAEQDGHGQEATRHSVQLRMLHGKDSSFADHVARGPTINNKRKSRPAPLFSSSLSTSPNKGGMPRRVDSSSGLKPRSPRSPLSPSQCSSPKRYNWGMRTPTSPRAPAAAKLQSPMFRALEEGLGAVAKSPVDLSFTHAHRKRGALAVGRQLRSPRRAIRDAGFMGGGNGDGEERDTEKHQRG
ncbi:MAG: hypothetical protein CYPHOPRED_002849 [Cyphobasidiales sp. Tagirdzhanova-0007]|nr:MAG: hypothetical protein CYPHOPRED_002849 [Cyphobasidiales sp. Tagirdzhanova-0007]